MLLHGATIIIVVGLTLNLVATAELPSIPFGKPATYDIKQGDGSFKYGYDTGTGTWAKAQSSGNNEVNGIYSYTRPDGIVDTVRYSAGVNGFQPNITSQAMPNYLGSQMPHQTAGSVPQYVTQAIPLRQQGPVMQQAAYGLSQNPQQATAIPSNMNGASASTQAVYGSQPMSQGNYMQGVPLPSSVNSLAEKQEPSNSEESETPYKLMFQSKHHARYEESDGNGHVRGFMVDEKNGIPRTVNYEAVAGKGYKEESSNRQQHISNPTPVPAAPSTYTNDNSQTQWNHLNVPGQINRNDDTQQRLAHYQNNPNPQVAAPYNTFGSQNSDTQTKSLRYTSEPVPQPTLNSINPQGIVFYGPQTVPQQPSDYQRHQSSPIVVPSQIQLPPAQQYSQISAQDPKYSQVGSVPITNYQVGNSPLPQVSSPALTAPASSGSPALAPSLFLQNPMFLANSIPQAVQSPQSTPLATSQYGQPLQLNQISPMQSVQVPQLSTTLVQPNYLSQPQTPNNLGAMNPQDPNVQLRNYFAATNQPQYTSQPSVQPNTPQFTPQTVYQNVQPYQYERRENLPTYQNNENRVNTLNRMNWVTNSGIENKPLQDSNIVHQNMIPTTGNNPFAIITNGAPRNQFPYGVTYNSVPQPSTISLPSITQTQGSDGYGISFRSNDNTPVTNNQKNTYTLSVNDIQTSNGVPNNIRIRLNNDDSNDNQGVASNEASVPIILSASPSTNPRPNDESSGNNNAHKNKIIGSIKVIDKDGVERVVDIEEDKDYPAKDEPTPAKPGIDSGLMDITVDATKGQQSEETTEDRNTESVEKTAAAVPIETKLANYKLRSYVSPNSQKKTGYILESE